MAAHHLAPAGVVGFGAVAQHVAGGQRDVAVAQRQNLKHDFLQSGLVAEIDEIFFDFVRQPVADHPGFGAEGDMFEQELVIAAVDENITVEIKPPPEIGVAPVFVAHLDQRAGEPELAQFVLQMTDEQSVVFLPEDAGNHRHHAAGRPGGRGAAEKGAAPRRLNHPGVGQPGECLAHGRLADAELGAQGADRRHLFAVCAGFDPAAQLIQHFLVAGCEHDLIFSFGNGRSSFTKILNPMGHFKGCGVVFTAKKSQKCRTRRNTGKVPAGHRRRWRRRLSECFPKTARTGFAGPEGGENENSANSGEKN
ncbi:hypothetical protein SDC9_79142 [bioreactor metagenome]|uniref:Uncharacterized protein n=1 Tax=bioreactor metagenome TaxID=1076179 RepID=A0A644YX34_9ZZZZ